MALHLANAGARVKAFIPALRGLTARLSANHAIPKVTECRDTSERATTPASDSNVELSPAAIAALAPLGLPPDGPIEPSAPLRARLAPDIAAGNFVSWARALELTGRYSRRGIYALYCEFSEVDERPPLSSARFFEALARIDGVAKETMRIGAARRSQWTIEAALAAPAPTLVVTDAPELAEAYVSPTTHAPAPEPAASLAALPVADILEPPASLLTLTKPVKAAIVLPRFAADSDHPFSPAGLREGAKSARRHRLNAAAARKQRGALRRVA
jgi:hypothetical protein